MKPVYTSQTFQFFEQSNDLFVSYKSNQPVKLSSFLGLSESNFKNYIKNNFEDNSQFFDFFIKLPKVLNTTKNKIVIANIQEAKDPVSAQIGLLNEKGLAPFEGLLIHNCSAIHMYGMKFPINVYFLNRDMTVIAKFEKVSINSATPFIPGSYFALETSTDQKDIDLYDQLTLVNYCN